MKSHGEITRTFKPSSASYWKGTAISAAIFAPFIAAQLAFNRDNGLFWILLLTLVPLVLLGLALYFRRAGIFITSTHVGKRSIFRTKWIPKADFDRSLILRNYSAPAEAARTEFFVFAADGRKLLRLFGRFWAEQDMLAIVEESGSTLSVVDDVMKPKDVLALEPTALPWVEAHPYAFATVVVFALFAVVTVIALVIQSL
jgi:hypothetical protein